MTNFCYIHIPFCSSKCKYCKFASFWNIDKLKVDLYINHLIEEIKNHPLTPSLVRKGGLLESIYFGWWTPSVLSLKQLKTIIDELKNKYGFSDDIEINMEATPVTITKENLIWWKKLWVNRLSIWVQSLNNKTLTEIWRWEKGDVIEALNHIDKQWFDNLSLDFIIWLPYVKKWWVKKDIEYLLWKYSFINHLSVYMLEEYYYPELWEHLSIWEDDYLEEYEQVSGFLKEKWFNRYEISNFAKKWFECKHNKAYWNHSEMLAFWLWAHWLINWERFSNSEKFIDYYSWKWVIKEKLNKDDIFLENIMFSLRTNWLTKKQIEKLNTKKINYFLDNWLLQEKNEKICLTNSWVLLLDYILKEMIK